MCQRRSLCAVLSALSSGSRLQKRGMAQLPWGEQLHFQSLVPVSGGDPIYSILPHVVFVHAAGIAVSDRPFHPTRLPGCERGDRAIGVSQKCPSRVSRLTRLASERKARQVPRIDPTEEATKR